MALLKAELQVEALIGAGQHAQVFRATCPTHGQVAVKIFRPLPGESDADWKHRKAQHLKEGKYIADAKHNNVVQVYYVAESDGGDAVHIVMEFCNGGSLQKAFDGGPLPLVEALQVTREVCLGLEALHGRNMLHRDIKPGNLLRAGGRAKIGDFGLVTDEIILGYAKAAGYSDHIAYEVWNGGGTSVRSDIWALGATIYRLLHGKEWYSRFPKFQIAAKNGGLADSLNWLPHVPKEVRRVVRKMLNDDSRQRYQTISQVMTALAKLPNMDTFACEVEPDEVVWVKTSKTRRTKVVWRKAGKTSFEWDAWSEPLKPGDGRRHTLGKSKGPVSRTQSLKELDAFFSSQ